MKEWSNCEQPEAAFHITGAERDGAWIITCDHATARVPPEIGTLGLPQADMERHIAYDIGARGVARALGERLNAPVISSNFSRLVIDPNRGLDDPTLIMQLYDGSIIPGNRALGVKARQDRIDRYYRPYDGALAAAYAARKTAAIVSVHSFTPQLAGKPKRPWEIGILFGHDARLSQALISVLKEEAGLTIGINEPYAGHLPGDAIDRHALASGRHNTLIELRQDLIADDAGQMAWAARLAAALKSAKERV
ncbi:MAG: N-formylglutamate amidohydrolase [Pseudomonadota bacterium]